jgi:hypothetical protein
MTIGYAAGANVAFQGNGSQGTLTFTGCNGSTNFPSGSIVVVAIGWYTGDGETAISSVTIGGQSATLINASGGAGTPQCNLYYASMPGSETDTVVINGATSTLALTSVAAAILTGAASTPTANSILPNASSGSDPQAPTTSISLPSGGVGIAALYAIDQASAATPTWSTTGNSNITASAGDINTNGGSTHFPVLLLAHSTTANVSWQPAVSGSPAFNFAAAMAAVTWAPGSGGGGASGLVLRLPRRIFVRR